MIQIRTLPTLSQELFAAMVELRRLYGIDFEIETRFSGEALEMVRFSANVFDWKSWHHDSFWSYGLGATSPDEALRDALAQRVEKLSRSVVGQERLATVNAESRRARDSLIAAYTAEIAAIGRILYPTGEIPPKSR